MYPAIGSASAWIWNGQWQRACGAQARAAGADETIDQGLRRQLRRLGADAIELHTGASYLRPIRAFMERRLRQHRR